MVCCIDNDEGEVPSVSGADVCFYPDVYLFDIREEADVAYLGRRVSPHIGVYWV